MNRLLFQICFHYYFFSSQIPKQYQNLNRQSKEKYDEHHAKLIEELIACDDFEDIATLKVNIKS